MENIMFKQKSFSMPYLGSCDLVSYIFYLLFAVQNRQWDGLISLSITTFIFFYNFIISLK